MSTIALQIRRMLTAALLAIVCPLLVGCGGMYDSSVTGTVALDGVAMQRGTVKFIPDQPGPSGYGLINADGAYEIMTGREAGLNPGSYTVTVVVNEESKPNPNPSLPPTPGKPVTPPWYRNEDQSPLKFSVESGSNAIDLKLTTTPPSGWTASRGR